VAVIRENDRFLVIRRARSVRAPRAFCFPGGGVEPGESEPVALRRELREELSAQVRIDRRLWRSVSASGVQLAWWQAQLEHNSPMQANPAEVESVHWLTIAEMLQLPQLLPSNREFLSALERGEFQLDPCASPHGTKLPSSEPPAKGSGWQGAADWNPLRPTRNPP
jgi:8-oxo-dGTP pyrophosphatase MutT (NUDIX family)